MSGLRCWPGALAYIVAPWSNPRMRGLVVTVIRAGSCGERVTRRDGDRSGIDSASRAAWLVDGPGYAFPCFIADGCLRPITPPPGADCTTHDADKPVEVQT